MKFFPFSALLFLAMPGFAQKIDLDAETVQVKHIELPSKPLPSNYLTYSVSVSANPADLKAVGLEELFFKNNLRIWGFQKIPNGGDFTLNLKLEDYKQGTGAYKTRNETTKDRNGKESTQVFHYYEASYQQSMELRVKDAAAKTIAFKSWMDFSRTFKSREFKTAREVSDYVTKQAIGRDLAADNQKQIIAAVKDAYNYLNSQFGFVPSASDFKLQILDTKKHADYAGFQTAYQTARTAFAASDATKPLDSVRMLIEPANAFFETQATKYNATDKAEKKLRYACLYNLALIHFWLENWEESSKYALAVVENDFDPKDGTRLIDKIKELQADLGKTSKTSRHFVLPEDAKEALAEANKNDADERKAESKEASLKLTPNSSRFDGTIMNTKGEETPVIFLVENIRTLGLLFGSGGNVRYAFDNGDHYVSRQINKSDIGAFSFDGRNFKIVPFKSANSVNIGGGKTVLEVLHDSPKVQAFLAFSGDKDGLVNPPEYVISDVQTSEYTSLNSMKFALNFNKGIKKKYSDCPGVLEAAENGGFKKTTEDIVRLAKLLEVCKQ